MWYGDEISNIATKVDIIQIRAYDSQDWGLKMDTYSSSREGYKLHYFWGSPTRVEMDIATGHHTSLTLFAVQQRSV